MAHLPIWTRFKGDRGTKSNPIPGPHLSMAATTAPNAIVEPIRPKAMPVILTTPEECDVWLRAVGRSQGAATPLANGVLRIVAREEDKEMR